MHFWHQKLFQECQKRTHIWKTKLVKSFMTLLLELLDQKKHQKSLECWLSCLHNRLNNILCLTMPSTWKSKKPTNILSSRWTLKLLSEILIDTYSWSIYLYWKPMKQAENIILKIFKFTQFFYFLFMLKMNILITFGQINFRYKFEFH